MSDLYRKVEGPTGDLEGDWFGMEFEVDGKVVEVAFVPVTTDYEAADEAVEEVFAMNELTEVAFSERNVVNAVLAAALDVKEGDEGE